MQRLILALQGGVTVITATQRLARHVTDHYNSDQQTRRERCWATARVLPWHGFIEYCWHQCLDIGIIDCPLATADWERCLWQQAIATTNPLLNVSATATDAIAAEKLVVHYAINRNQIDTYGTAEASAYCAWSQHVRDSLLASTMISFSGAEEQLIGIVQRHFQQLRQRFPHTIMLAAFERLTPLQQRLLAALKDHGITVAQWQPQPCPAPQIVRYELNNEEDELRASATWARQQLEKNTHLRIAIITDDIQQRRHRIEHVFSDCLHPQHLLPDFIDTTHRAFNISLGAPLATLPVVSDALAALALLAPTVSVRIIGQVLRSPFFFANVADAVTDDEEEYRSHILLDATLRRRSEPLTTLDNLLIFADRLYKRENIPPPKILNRLHRIASVAKTSATTKLGAHAWGDYFTNTLQSLIWPGERRSDPVIWQAVSATQEVLLRFSSLDGILPVMTVDSALRQITTLLRDTVHQPRSLSSVPIHILGGIESLGMVFDRLWVIGANSEHWPGEVRTNAFLPLALQRRFELPHSSPAAIREQALTTLSRLQATADEVVFSHALTVDDRKMIGSPLIAAIPLATPTHVRVTAIEEQCQQTVLGSALEPVDDPKPQLTNGNQPHWSIVQVLQHQAQCPFKAFATHRLAATSVASSEHAWDARHRGQLIHLLMANIWQHLGDQQHLKDSLALIQLEPLIEKSAKQALNTMQRRYPTTVNEGLRRLEQQRLCQLAAQWLNQVELPRAPFVVKAHEETLEMEWHGLSIRIRPDRIDTLGRIDTPAGSVCVLDYKSSPHSPNEWHGDRPDDPQLPFYTIALQAQGAQVTAPAFAIFSSDPNKMRLHSINESSPEELANTIAAWQKALTALAQAFISGNRDVDPKPPSTVSGKRAIDLKAAMAKTCRYCELSPLCRVHELRDALSSVNT